MAGNYTNFDVAIYIPVKVVQSFENPDKLQGDWDRISCQLKVDKVYIEVQRNRDLASDELLGANMVERIAAVERLRGISRAERQFSG